jgi:photosystem II stability/assembly factor-like uncharacterized protein
MCLFFITLGVTKNISVRVFFFLFFLLFNCVVFSQSLIDFSEKSKKYVKAISEMKSPEIEIGSEFKQYVRWKYYMEPRLGLNGECPNINLFDSKNYYKLENTIASSNWQFIGPNYYSTGPIDSYAPGIGRADVIVFHPNNDSIIFIGTPTGGLWKTVDAGQTWNVLTDNLTTNSLGIADLVIDPTNPNHMYLATGDGDSPTFSWSLTGEGILESNDGGMTWQSTNFVTTVSSFHWITRLLMHPTNPNIMYAATKTGIYKTTDGWQTGTIVLSQTNIEDMEFMPGNPNYIYACRQNQIYKSTFGGNSFVLKHSFSGNARIRMAVTNNAPNNVYVLASGNSSLIDVFVSHDMGETYSAKLFHDNNILLMDILGGYYVGNNTLDINVSPVDSNQIYVGSGNIYRYNINSWTQLTTSDIENLSLPYVHGDVHNIAFNSQGQLYVGCDGGLFRKAISTNTWSDLSNGLQITQIYKIGAHETDPLRVNIGTQDCGQMELRLNGNWEQVTGSDGWMSYYHPTDSNTYYTSIIYGNVYRTMDNGATQDTIINTANPPFTVGPNFGAYRFVSPFVMHPQQGNILYIAYDDIYRSNDGGNNWTKLSNQNKNFIAMAVSYTNPDKYYIATASQFYYTANNCGNMILRNLNTNGASITDITVDPDNDNRVWVTLSGYISGQKVYYSNDAGASWTNISSGLPNMPINCMAFVNDSINEMYVGTDIGVFVRNDSLGAWIPYSDNLPNIIVYDLAINYSKSTIMAGTFGRGLWENSLYTNITSVNTNVEEPKISSLPFYVYPNPSKGVIQLDAIESITKLAVVNITGQTVFRISGKENGKTIDLNHLPKGQYVIVAATTKHRFTQSIVLVE